MRTHKLAHEVIAPRKVAELERNSDMDTIVELDETEQVNGISAHEPAEAPKRRPSIRKARPAVAPPVAHHESPFAALKAEAEEAVRHAADVQQALIAAAKKELAELDRRRNEVQSILGSQGVLVVESTFGVDATHSEGHPIAKPKRARIDKANSRQRKPTSSPDVVSVIAKAGQEGARSSDIQSALNLTRDEARILVQAAIEAGHVKARGKARGMRYFAQ